MVVCNLIYKDGYSTSYYSDDQQIEFKHIFILIDEYSASCSELLTEPDIIVEENSQEAFMAEVSKTIAGIE